jgi:hypothetical protein
MLCYMFIYVIVIVKAYMIVNSNSKSIYKSYSLIMLCYMFIYVIVIVVS